MHSRGPAGREAETVNFADNGIARYADLGSDLTARQSSNDTISQFVNPICGPGLNTHRQPPPNAAADLGR